MRYARALDPAISSTMEVTYLLTLGLLGIGFLLMEKFIKVYASTLVTWSQQISTMEEVCGSLFKQAYAIRKINAFKSNCENFSNRKASQQ